MSTSQERNSPSCLVMAFSSAASRSVLLTRIMDLSVSTSTSEVDTLREFPRAPNVMLMQTVFSVTLSAGSGGAVASCSSIVVGAMSVISEKSNIGRLNRKPGDLKQAISVNAVFHAKAGEIRKSVSR